MREESIREFGSHEGVLWRVLGALARNGYPVPPNDARDLIHDFYLDAWPGVNERFDPKLGPFTGYISSAFYRFARRRILNSENFTRRTVDFDSAVAQLASDSTPPDILESRERHAAVSAALGILTPLERTVLEEHLSSEKVSERSLARRHKLSRYAVREVLADSLGKVAVLLGHTPAMSKSEENIAELLWKYGQSPRNVASLLNISVADVQLARNQVVATLMAQLRRPNQHAFLGRLKMKHEEALKILSSALTSPDDEQALNELRKHNGAIQHALEQSDLVLDDKQWSQIQAHPEWIAQIYESLSDTKAETDISEVSKAVAAIREQEESEIGEAFAALLEQLPARFSMWSKKWFRTMKPVSEDYRKKLMRKKSVRSAGTAADDLVFFGMTPETVYAATRGLQLLFNRMERLVRSENFEESAPRSNFSLPKSVHVHYGFPHGLVLLPEELILAEVASTPHLPRGAEKGLASWLIDALQYKPYLIECYRAQVNQDTLAMHPAPKVRDGAIQRGDLISLWTRGHSPYRDMEAAAAM